MYELFKLDQELNNFFTRSNSFRDLTSRYRETDKAYLLSVDLPGVFEKDLSINLENNVLTVNAERKDEFDTEKSFSSYNQSFRIPKNVNSDELEAVLKDGVLKVVIPKSEKSLPKQITLKDKFKNSFWK